MSETIDTYWSFRSPYSYLATPDLLRLRDDYDVEVRLRVVLPLAVRNRESVFDPANLKPALYILLDSKRRAEYLGMPLTFPPKPDPVVQDLATFEVPPEQPYIYRLCKLGVEAERRGRGVEFAASVSRLIMGGTRGWDKGDYLSQAAASAGLDLNVLEAAIANGDHLEEIERNHAALEAAGHWGVPTMVVRGEPFFGQDRIETLRWRLDQYGLARV
ncbi:MAG: DsbA family protein [Pseudomonadales bacterium]|nr:DsbA family protein [Pseudomonadales bacterium]MCP5202851.1 DsbA family protein [Pseudomonadales bacterium]